MTTPPDDNPFRTPDFAAAPAAPGGPPIPHWFTVKVRIVLAVCVVAALGLGVLGAFGVSWIGRSGPPGEGDCLYLTRETAGRLAYHRVGCGEQAATYKVERSYRTSTTCAGDYVRFRVTGTTARTLCLALNVDTGDCLHDVDDQVAAGKIGCGAPGAQERARVLPGMADEAECEDPDATLYYPGPPRRTICLEKTGESI